MWDGKFTQENTDESKENIQMRSRADELKNIIKEDIMTKGIKVGYPAVEHLLFLLRNHYHPEVPYMNVIRFYVMGYAAGVQSEHYDREARKR